MVRRDIVKFEGYLDANGCQDIVVRDEYGNEGQVEDYFWELLNLRLNMGLEGNESDLRYAPKLRITIETLEPA